jgi:hypothetical protein
MLNVIMPCVAFFAKLRAVMLSVVMLGVAFFVMLSVAMMSVALFCYNECGGYAECCYAE